MKISVKLFATLIQIVPETVRGRYPQGIRAAFPLEIELPGGSTLADLVDEVHDTHHPLGVSLYYEDQKEAAQKVRLKVVLLERLQEALSQG